MVIWPPLEVPVKRHSGLLRGGIIVGRHGRLALSFVDCLRAGFFRDHTRDHKLRVDAFVSSPKLWSRLIVPSARFL